MRNTRYNNFSLDKVFENNLEVKQTPHIKTDMNLFKGRLYSSSNTPAMSKSLKKMRIQIDVEEKIGDLSVRISPCQIHQSLKNITKKVKDSDKISGVMIYYPQQSGGFKIENAMSFVPDHLQPSNNARVNEDFLVSQEKAQKLLKVLEDRNSEQRIKNLNMEICGLAKASEILNQRRTNNKRENKETEQNESKDFCKVYKRFTCFEDLVDLKNEKDQKGNYDVNNIARVH
eukprot:CAMPEP_0205803084 /NCGR_PEP_ID=MMETSP0205-20121125/5630_1 /ASSEMBLY_ACC=CAM_ASM_000278 /TAXON_ID=36767 /ORGANISM="Euplotes focardii, Strain TN1" /LENGTH=229 /DNA_ID=CAMNT_0053070593 /DNA_START=79 /DNA_END=768 /DNA_ORIENTATION=-